MPSKAMTQSSDSPNPAAPEMPLYAVVENGQFYLLDVQDTPCLTITADGRDEMANRLPMDALPQIDLRLAPPVGDDYGGF
jgi:hypothetical protein